MKATILITTILFIISGFVKSQNTPIVGQWQLSYVTVGDEVHDNLKAVFCFEENGILKSSRSINDELEVVGQWIYNPEDQLLLMSSKIDKDFNGEATVLQLSPKELVYQKGEATLFFKHSDVAPIISVDKSNNEQLLSLNFTIDDFFDDNDEYKYYDHEEKLPWNNIDHMISSLVGVEQLVYNYTKQDAGDGQVSKKTLKADVKASVSEHSLSIDFIFYGYDRYNLPEDTDMMPNEDFNTLLYPEKENTFRVAGKEQVTITAGQFSCTVVEVAGEFDECRKLWMIDDKPGVYAKIVVAKPGDFGHYATYELIEIK